MAKKITVVVIFNFFIEFCWSLTGTKAILNELYRAYNINLPFIIQYPIGRQIKQIQLILDGWGFIIFRNICTIRQCAKSRESGENISYIM